MRSSRHIFVAHKVKLYQIQQNNLITALAGLGENQTTELLDIQSRELLYTLKSMGIENLQDLAELSNLEQLAETLGGPENLEALYEIFKSANEA